jgi:hypothetical protein
LYNGGLTNQGLDFAQEKLIFIDIFTFSGSISKVFRLIGLEK